MPLFPLQYNGKKTKNLGMCNQGKINVFAQPENLWFISCSISNGEIVIDQLDSKYILALSILIWAWPGPFLTYGRRIFVTLAII